MAARFVNLDRDTPMFLPCDLCGWLPADHIVHFILEAVGQIPTAHFSCKWGIRCTQANGQNTPPVASDTVRRPPYLVAPCVKRIPPTAQYQPAGTWLFPRR
jgi:hypothetical protein